MRASERFDHHLPDTPEGRRVVVLGASQKPARYANQAMRLLLEKGYQVIPVHPKIEEIEGLAVVDRLARIAQPVHTLTLYIGPQRGEPMLDEIIQLMPRRVIFNPGTESELMMRALRHKGILCVEGCTLVMLKTGQF